MNFNKLHGAANATIRPILLSQKRKDMARFALRPIILIFMLGSGIMCQPEKINPTTLTGKLVLNRACANYVIQVLQGTIEPSKIDALWKNPDNDSTYINVFTVANRCTFPDSLKEGDTISFEIDTNPPAQTCAVCAISYPTPPVSNDVKNVQKAK